MKLADLPLLGDLVRWRAGEQHPACRTFQTTAAEDGDGGIRRGDTVVYVRANSTAADGQTVVAVMGEGGQMKFGRATKEPGGRVRLGDATFPAHFTRGVVVAAHRTIGGNDESN